MHLPPNARKVLEAVSGGARISGAIEEEVDLPSLKVRFNLRLLIMHGYVRSTTDLLLRAGSLFKTTEKGRTVVLSTRDLSFLHASLRSVDMHARLNELR